jgi:hypothetical protein
LHREVVDYRFYAANRSAVVGSQSARSLIADTPIQRRNSIHHAYLDVLLRQRRLTFDLRLNVACDLLIRWRGRLLHLASSCKPDHNSQKYYSCFGEHHC